MSNPRLTAQDVRATAEVHGELGPDYSDAVIESFLAKLDQTIEARVDERLAGMSKPRRKPVNSARLAKLRAGFIGAAVATVLVGGPLTIIAASALVGSTGHAGRLAYIWVVLAVVYGLAGYGLWRRR
jgi:hypothetical protein